MNKRLTLAEPTSVLEGEPRDGAMEPILAGFYPDPTICRVGDDFYLACSSFEYFPGAPIFHSTDLLTWRQLGNIIDRPSQLATEHRKPSTGIYGSTLRYRGGRFWFISTDVSSFESGQLLFTATDPAGPWSDPIVIHQAVGIDPDLCWDGETCYLTWNALNFDDGGVGIRQAPIDLETGRLLQDPYPLWDGSGLMAPEGPHLYQIGEYWYLLLAEGGTERGHAVTVARSRSPRGPFEAHPANPVFSHRSTAHPVQNVGHADLVQTAGGEWAAVYLGSRPRGSTPGFHVNGRETFIAGIDWVNGWPVFDEGRFSLPARHASFTDDFSDTALHPRWITPHGTASTTVRSAHGGLTLSEDEDHTIGFRVQDAAWRADAEFIGDGTFRVRIDDRHWYGLTVIDGHVVAEARIGDVIAAVGEGYATSDDVVLRLESVPPAQFPTPRGHAGPDDIVLSFSSGGITQELARLDGRYLSTEVAGGFTGRVLTLGAVGGDAQLSRVSYQPLKPGAPHVDNVL